MPTALTDAGRQLMETLDVPIEFTPPSRNGHDDLRDVASLPHDVRGLQSEVTAVVADCLHELDGVCELLRALETPFVRGDRQQPVAGPTETGHYEPAAVQPTFAGNPEQGDFDARLANLKRMLAEKLIDQEPTKP